MKVSMLSAACGGLFLSGPVSQGFSNAYGVHLNTAQRIEPKAVVTKPPKNQNKNSFSMRSPQAQNQVVTLGSQSFKAVQNDDSASEPVARVTENPKFLDRLLPVEQFIGLEGVRDLPKIENPFKRNYFFRQNIKGFTVSPHWPSRVNSLSDKGPFPVEQKAIEIELTNGKRLSAIVSYPAQKERDSDKPLPIVFYEPPAFVGQVDLPANKVFYDAQFGEPLMKHMASYNMVGVTLFQPGSVLFDGVSRVNHKADADDLNEIMDLLTASGQMDSLGIPSVDESKIALIAYSRGAKIALLAAADRIEKNQSEGSHSKKVVTIAKDPVNTGGVPPAIVEMLRPWAEEMLPSRFRAWEESSLRYPVAPLPGADPEAEFPISKVTNPVLIFEADIGPINPDPKYSAKVFFDALPKDSGKDNLLVSVKGPHESWVNDYNIKGDSMKVMTAYLLNHLCDKHEFSSMLEPVAICSDNASIGSVRRGGE